MYEITLYPNTLGPWFTQVYAGLFDLQRSNKARITISPRLPHSDLMDSAALLLEAKNTANGKKRMILIDLNDNTPFSVPQAVERYDLTAKRSFLGQRIAELSAGVRERVVPYGINFNCNSPSVPILHLFVVHHLMRLRLIGKPKTKKLALWWQHQLRFLFYLTRSNLSLYEKDFEGSPQEKTKYDVFFLTRLFEVKRGELSDFSRDRIQLVQELKNEFGENFFGGIVIDEISKRHCPRGLLVPKVSRREFVETLKRSDIAICTLGVGKSNPWKLGEAIAAARCVVSEPLYFGLPVPLEEGRHIRTFVTIQDCLRTCQELVRKPDLIKQMKGQVWEYYQQNVKAERLIERVLFQAFSESKYSVNQFRS